MRCVICGVLKKEKDLSVSSILEDGLEYYLMCRECVECGISDYRDAQGHKGCL